MVHTKTSPVPNAEVKGTLRLFYLIWNIIGTLIFGIIATSPKMNLVGFEKIYIFVFGYLIWTFISYVFGVIFRIMPLGFIDTGLRIRTRITFKTYALALIAQSVPLWGSSMLHDTWQTPFVIAGGLLFLWLSSKYIKINIPKQQTREN